MKNKETHFVVWSDGAITVIYREKNNDKLSNYTDYHTYSSDEAKELAEKFNKVVRG